MPMAWIDVVGDNGAFVSALLKGPASTNVVGASEYLSANQWLELWSAHTGIPTGFKRSSAEEYANNDPVGLMQELFESFQFMEEYGSGGGNPSVWSPDEVRQLWLVTRIYFANCVSVRGEDRYQDPTDQNCRSYQGL